MSSSEKKNKPGVLAIALSTLAAAFGVQSEKNLKRDFSQSSPLPFIIAGIVFTAIFVISLILIVQVILKTP